MKHIDVVYTPRDVQPPSAALDTVSLLEQLRAIVGDELASGWRVTASDRMDIGAVSSGQSSLATPWLVTLANESTDSSRHVQEGLLAAADPQLRLCLDTEPQLPPGPPIESLSLPLPVSVPSVLLGSEAAQRKRAALEGVSTGIVVSAILGLLTPSGSVIRHMFDPRTPTAAVPIAILCLFFWGVVYCMNRRGRLAAIEILNAPDLLPAVVTGLQNHGVERLEMALRGEVDQYSVVRFSPLLRRIWVTLEQWLIRPSLQNAHLVIEQQVMLDREATHRAYNLLRIFVWATPVLGLIGTVVGISIAVGGFATFLSTNVDDISKIKAGLVNVTGGLSFAFLITLEGLVTSLILMLVTASLQTREERLYAGIERDVAERFLPELQRISPQRQPSGVSPAADAWADALSDTTRKVIKAVETAGRKILAKWDEKHESYVSDLNETGETVNNSARTVAVALGDALLAQKTLQEGIASLGNLTAQVLESQAVLQSAMAELRNSGLSNVLPDLSASGRHPRRFSLTRLFSGRFGRRE